MKPELYGASISDVHLGHQRTKTRHIVDNLWKAFPNAESTGQLDVIFWGGDLFDRLLTLGEEAVPQILVWAYSFLEMAKERKIHVVFMEGTPSHDWAQTKLLKTIAEFGKGNPYFHYIDTLSIVHFDDLDADVLFVPDEWRPEPDDTWMEVRELLREKGLEKVDFTLLHGVFDHQLPDHVSVPTHVTERYVSITRHFVFGAHVHTPSVRDNFPADHGRLYVNGSFDRLAHGEEESKGHWRFRFPTDKPPQCWFVVNEGAQIYKTLDCTKKSLEESLAFLQQVSKLPEDSSIRVQANKDDPILANFDVLRREYPHIHWSSKPNEAVEKDVQKNLLVDLRSAYASVQITRDNLEELLMERIGLRTNDPDQLQRCARRIQEVVR